MNSEDENRLQEPKRIKPWRLPEYLEGQEKGIPTCLERYNLEFHAFTDLGELFDKLAEAWRPQGRSLSEQERLRLIFLYCVKQQMYGAVFMLLRLRIVDALSITRYAIEATALAHHLWKKPELFDIYIQAYPNINDHGSPSQWKLSPKYRDMFNTGELFGSLKKSLPSLAQRLSNAYAIVCYRASHAGPGIIHNLKSREGKIFYHANELDETKVDQCWAILLVYYFDMLEVFYAILRQYITTENQNALEQDFSRWRDKVLPRLAQEAKNRQDGNQSEGATTGNK